MTKSVLHRISFYSVVNGYYQHLELKQLCNRNIDHKHSSQTWLWRLWCDQPSWWCLGVSLEKCNYGIHSCCCFLVILQTWLSSPPLITMITTKSPRHDHHRIETMMMLVTKILANFFFRRQCACSLFWDSLSSELKQITWVGATGFRWHLSLQWMQWTHRRHLKGDHGCFVDEISCLCVLWISSLCGFEISVFTLCRDSDVDGAWQEERERFDSAEIHSLVFAGRCHHYGRHDDHHHHDQDDDHDDHQT